LGTANSKQSCISCHINVSDNKKQEAVKFRKIFERHTSSAKETKVKKLKHPIYHGSSCNTYGAQHASAAAY